MADVQKLQVGNEGRMRFAFRNTHSFHIAAAQDLGQVFFSSGVDICGTWRDFNRLM